MEFTSLCLIFSATLSIQPDRSQFFWYESFTLDCGAPVNSSSWTVKRNTSTNAAAPCSTWGRSNRTSCTNHRLFSTDSGLYWCQSEHGGCSNVINVTVNLNVILESPARPVMEGDEVTLRCSYRKTEGEISTSDFNALFYRNGSFIGTYSGGKMVLPAVSKSKHEGFYKCSHPTKVQSVESFLAVEERPLPVTARPPMTLLKLLCTVLLFILYTAILLLSIYMYRRWARARADAKV